MSSFKDKVEDLAGVTITDTSALSDYLTASTREVADHIPDEALMRNSTLEESTSTIDVSSKRVFAVSRGGRLSTEIPFGLSTQAGDSGSIHFATERSPAHYFKGKTLTVLPTPTGAKKAQLLRFVYPSVAHGDTGISDFPDTAEYAVTLGATSKFLNQLMSASRVAIPALLTIDDLSISSNAPSDPNPALNTQIGSLGTAPAYSKPTITTLPNAISSSGVDMSVFSAPSAPSLSGGSVGTIPDAPTYTAVSPDFANFSSSLPSSFSISFTSVTLPADLSASTNAFMSGLGSNAIGNTPSVPTSIDDISINNSYSSTVTSLNSSITAGDFEEAQAYLDKLRIYIQQYQTDIQEKQTDWNVEMEKYKADIAKALKNPDLVSAKNEQIIRSHQSEVARYQAEVNREISVFRETTQSKLATYNAEVQRYIGLYNVQIQDNANKFRENLEKFQADVQKLIKTGEFASELDRAKVQKYASEIQSYSAQVSNAVQEFQAETAEKIGVYNAKVGAFIQQYQADIQNEVNEFNKDVEIYRSTVQKAIKQAELDSMDDANTLRKYDSQVQAYSQNVNKEVQEYQANLSQKVQEHTSNIQRQQFEFTTLQQQFQNIYQMYQAEIQRLRGK